MAEGRWYCGVSGAEIGGGGGCGVSSGRCNGGACNAPSSITTTDVVGRDVKDVEEGEEEGEGEE